MPHDQKLGVAVAREAVDYKAASAEGVLLVGLPQRRCLEPLCSAPVSSRRSRLEGLEGLEDLQLSGRPSEYLAPCLRQDLPAYRGGWLEVVWAVAEYKEPAGQFPGSVPDPARQHRKTSYWLRSAHTKATVAKMWHLVSGT